MIDTRPFEISGDALSLDFSNTWGARTDAASDRLHDYHDLLRFSRQSELIGDEEAAALRRAASKDPAAAARVFAEAIALREIMYGVFSALAGDQPIGDSDLEDLNRFLVRALPHLRLAFSEKGCRWEWSRAPESLEGVLWPIIRSAADLLTSPDAGRLGECDSPTCSWLFIDRSRNHRRRWCDMATCGNRAKARRYYRRHQ